MKPIYLPRSDARLQHLARIAQQEGCPILTKPSHEATVCLFPPSAKAEEILPEMERAPRGGLFVVGKKEGRLIQKAQEKLLSLLSLLDEERYLASNSRITAEGVLAAVIEKTSLSLSQLCVLVYGYGNCGRAIARLLWLCGVEVWVWSRAKGQMCARNDGFNVFHAPTLGLGMFDCVIGTVPEAVYPPSLLSTMPSGSTFFQVASGTSGIDEALLAAGGVSFVPLPALPAKVAPESEAEVIWSILKEHPFMKEEGTA